MKHLKTYNESKYDASREIRSNLMDICLELNDLGINSDTIVVDVDQHEVPYWTSFNILILRIFKFTPFEYSEEIKEVIERIKDYINGLGNIIYKTWFGDFFNEKEGEPQIGSKINRFIFEFEKIKK